MTRASAATCNNFEHDKEKEREKEVGFERLAVATDHPSIVGRLEPPERWNWKLKYLTSAVAWSTVVRGRTSSAAYKVGGTNQLV